MSGFFKKYKFILGSLAIAIFVAIIFFPEIYVNHYLVPYYYPYEKETNKIQDIKDTRESIIKIIAGTLGVLGAAYGFHLNTKRTSAIETQTDSIFKQTSATIQQVETSKKQLRELIRKNKQDKMTDDNNLILQQFSKATELLNDTDSITTRLSGIYLFEQIMNNSEEYHFTVIELLTTFVREKRGRYNDKYYIGFAKEVDIPKYEKEIDFLDDTMFKINEIRTHHFQTEYGTDYEELEFTAYYKKFPMERDIQVIISVLGRRNINFEKQVSTSLLNKYLDLSDAYLYQSDFSKDGSATEELSNFNHFIFRNSILVESKCGNTSFKNANFEHAHLEYAHCSNAHFEHAHCSNTHFEYACCDNANFEYAHCYSTNFTYTVCLNTNFEHAFCLSANFKHADCSHANFEHAGCEGSNFKYADCNHVNFAQANCFGVNFQYANCRGANFEHTFCNSANFEHAGCEGSNFKYANCNYVDFEHADCRDTHFDNTFCGAAYFKNADCTNTNFKNTFCIGTYFEHADCKGANFEQAICAATYFENSHNITAEQLSKAATLKIIFGLSNEMKKEIIGLNLKLKDDLCSDEKAKQNLESQVGDISALL